MDFPFRRRFFFASFGKIYTFATDFNTESDGVVAQLVEQRTENPCVTGSIPVNATQAENQHSS